jgi:hypothetical protein
MTFRSTHWTLFNLIGIGVYLYFASWVWTAGDGEMPGSDDAFVYMLSAFPVLCLFALCNLIWLCFILFDDRPKGVALRHWMLIIVAWIVANRIDAGNR